MSDSQAGVSVAVPEQELQPLEFEAFFETASTGLYRALWLLTGDRHEAEEVMQDAFLRLWERWPRISGLEDPTGYLYRTSMNVFRSRVRRAKVALRRVVVRPAPEDGLSAVEGRDSVVRALAPLSPRQRAAFVLTEVLGLTSEEAARLLGIKSSTVRVLVTRARTTLRRELGDNPD